MQSFKYDSIFKANNDVTHWRTDAATPLRNCFSIFFSGETKKKGLLLYFKNRDHHFLG